MSIPLPSGNTNRIKPKGFTLTELLVVITIIVVLAVLSTLGVSKLRSSARGATCTSNLRQLGAAMISYTTDENGQLPPLEDRTKPGDGLAGIWTNIVGNGGYLPTVLTPTGLQGTNAGVWSCPDCESTSRWHGGYGGAEGKVMQVMKSSVPGSGSLRLTQIPNPERTWLVGDANNNATNLKSSWYAIWSNPASWTKRGPAARHGDKVNVCMVDGHVESLTLKELRSPDKDYTMFKK